MSPVTARKPTADHLLHGIQRFEKESSVRSAFKKNLRARFSAPGTGFIRYVILLDFLGSADRSHDLHFLGLNDAEKHLHTDHSHRTRA
jgi:hypothetical protein